MSGFDLSPAQRIAIELVRELGPAAYRVIDLALAQLSVPDRAALAYNWRGFWARSKQLIPPGPWLSYGFKTGRAFGKTRAIAEFVDQEIREGRAGRVALCAETEDKTRDVLVEGQSGLLAVARPWFKPRWEPGNNRLVYPNGAQAFVFYATEPNKFRGPEFHLFWGDEIGAWPTNTGEKCWEAMSMAVRLRGSKLVWSSTPRSTGLMSKLSARAQLHPEQHIIVRGSSVENWSIPIEVVEGWLEEYGGTRLGKREIEGEDLDDNPGAIFRPEFFNRRRAPDVFVRTVVAVDPAISTRKGSDKTGIVVAGLATDRQIFILADLSGQYSPERWGKLTIDAFNRYGCDLIVFEENRGGNLVLRNLRAFDSKISPEKFKGVYARQGKELRAEPVATLYEKGRVSHAVGADLADLEKEMVDWDPTATPQSPDRIDAMVHAVLELAKLGPKDKDFDDYRGDRVASRMADTYGNREWSDDSADNDEADDYTSKW